MSMLNLELTYVALKIKIKYFLNKKTMLTITNIDNHTLIFFFCY